MFVYTTSPATPGSSSTSATPNTETDAIYLKPAAAVPVRSPAIQRVDVIGKAAALTAISSIAFRIAHFTTASTGGTAATPTPKDVGSPAATAVASTGGTISSTGRVNHAIFGCGAGGPGGWQALNADSVISAPAESTQPSVDLLAVSGTASLNYEFAVEHQEQ
jgi:hypothetical protein